MKRLAVVPALGVCAALGFLAGSCGGDNDAVSQTPVTPQTETNDRPEPGSQPEASVSTAPEDEPGDTGGETVTYEVWFHRSERQGKTPQPKLFVVHRTERALQAVGTAAVEALLAGPNNEEIAGDVQTAVPPETDLLALDIEDGVATVDLSSEYLSGGGSLSLRMRLAQVVYTLTQFPTVRGVRFRLDGEPVHGFAGEGISLDHPVTRRDYEELVPTILVESPSVGSKAGNPVTISGTANVFEANVTVRILLDEGPGRQTELARTFTTATCGTGCRGVFSVSMSYRVTEEQTGVIVVHDDDAAGKGFPPHEVRIPVRLTPASGRS